MAELTCANFRIGNIVQANCGGPLMHVSNVNCENKISCTWFDGAQFQVNIFAAEELTIQKPPSGKGKAVPYHAVASPAWSVNPPERSKKKRTSVRTDLKPKKKVKA